MADKGVVTVEFEEVKSVQFGAKRRSPVVIVCRLPIEELVVCVVYAVSIRGRRRSPALADNLAELRLNLQELKSFFILDRSNEAVFVALDDLCCLSLLPIEEGRVGEEQFASVKLVVRRAEQLHELMEGN